MRRPMAALEPVPMVDVAGVAGTEEGTVPEALEAAATFQHAPVAPWHRASLHIVAAMRLHVGASMRAGSGLVEAQAAPIRE